MKSLYETILSSTGTGKAAKEIAGYHIGDIIVAVFQYSARYVDFYEVVDLQGKATVVLKKLQKKNVRDDGYGQNGECVPIEGEYASKNEIKERVGRKGLHIDNRYCYKWEGKPEMFYTD